jgi:hypothetical protein
MKINGTCHGRCFYCQRRQRHLLCAAVNPDKMIDGVPHSWCEICHQYVTYKTLSNRSCHGPCRFCGSRVIHHKCNPAIPHNRQYTTRATQWYTNQPLASRMEEARVRQHLPANEAYQMIRGLNLNVNPNIGTVISTTSLDRINEYHGPHREIETTRARARSEAMERLERATNPEIMEDKRVNMNRRLNPLTAYISTSPVSPRSDSSGGVEIVEGPKPEVIDLSIDEIEAMFMNDVTDQTTLAEAQATADAKTEDEARRSGKSDKRKKTDDTNKCTERKDLPGPDSDKGRRLA